MDHVILWLRWAISDRFATHSLLLRNSSTTELRVVSRESDVTLKSRNTNRRSDKDKDSCFRWIRVGGLRKQSVNTLFFHLLLLLSIMRKKCFRLRAPPRVPFMNLSSEWVFTLNDFRNNFWFYQLRGLRGFRAESCVRIKEAVRQSVALLIFDLEYFSGAMWPRGSWYGRNACVDDLIVRRILISVGHPLVEI